MPEPTFNKIESKRTTNETWPRPTDQRKWIKKNDQQQQHQNRIAIFMNIFIWHTTTSNNNVRKTVEKEKAPEEEQIKY